MSAEEEAFEAARAEIALAAKDSSEMLDFAKERFRALERIPNEISQCNALRLLDLTRTKVSDITPLAGLWGLADLRLERTPVVDLSPLSGLKSSNWLSLAATNVEEIGPLSRLTELTSLILVNTDVSKLGPLSSLKKS